MLNLSILIYSVPFFLAGLSLGIFAWRFSASVALAFDIVIGAFSVITFVSIYLFRNVDPGFLPTKIELTAAQVPFDSSPSVDNATERINDVGLNEKFCRHCQLWRPSLPEHGHCHFCRTCVRGYDHHCGVLGGCVGAGNHRFFISFTASLWCAAAAALVAVIWRFSLLAGDNDSWHSWEVYVCLFCGWLFLIALFSGNLCFLHVWMLCGNITMKSHYGFDRRPWQFEPTVCVHKFCAEPINMARSEHPENMFAAPPVYTPVTVHPTDASAVEAVEAVETLIDK